MWAAAAATARLGDTSRRQARAPALIARMGPTLLQRQARFASLVPSASSRSIPAMRHTLSVLLVQTQGRVSYVQLASERLRQGLPSACVSSANLVPMSMGLLASSAQAASFSRKLLKSLAWTVRQARTILPRVKLFAKNAPLASTYRYQEALRQPAPTVPAVRMPGRPRVTVLMVAWSVHQAVIRLEKRTRTLRGARSAQLGNSSLSPV